MLYTIYPLVSGREGRKLGEFPVGTVSFEEGEMILDCPDYTVSRRLNTLLAAPLMVRKPLGSPSTVITYAWEELAPGSEEHFLEAVARFHSMGYIGVLEQQ